MKRRLRILLAAVAAWACLAAPAAAEERITSFDSLIEVARDGTLTVTERIDVVAEGKQIKRGIYRDFPTTYQGRWGTRVVVPFEVLGVERDGRREPYHTEAIDGGIRVYMGAANREVARGPHGYALTYRTRRQIGFFDEHDELYWNVTGNFWNFAIERASATVRLPDGVEPDRVAHAAYTGPVGSGNRDFRSSLDPASGDVRFATTSPLPAGHGLTILAMFPKGHVQPPSDTELRQALYDANKAFFIGAAGALCVLAYYLGAWLLVGRDPVRGTIIPRFEPPRGISPACMRHLMRMGYDHTCFATALVSMAVKGYLRIEQRNGEYTLVRSSEDRSGLSGGERRIAERLLRSGRFELTQRRHASIRTAIGKFKERLRLENEGELFLANRRWFVPGVAISIGAVLAAGLGGSAGVQATAAFVLIWLSIWTLGVWSLLREAFRRWSTAIRSRSGMERVAAWVSAILISAFAAPFAIGECVGLALLTRATSPWMVPILLFLIGINVVFYGLLKRPTLAGQALRDEIEGFKMYLRTAEGDEIRRLQAPKPSAELFERYLPYALALGVENDWAARFEAVLERAGEGVENDYAPTWYHGSNFRSLGVQGLASSVGSALAGAVASTSTAPGSSSGGGGGGFSGGGGGGGGGGGW